jgi:hypothetical protein
MTIATCQLCLWLFCEWRGVAFLNKNSEKRNTRGIRRLLGYKVVVGSFKGREGQIFERFFTSDEFPLLAGGVLFDSAGMIIERSISESG